MTEVQELHQRLEALERKVECLEVANHNMAEWAGGIERALVDLNQAIRSIAKAVGLKPAKGPGIPEAY